MDANRISAYKILMKIEKDGSFSNLAIKDYINANPVESPKLVRRLVYGVIENKLYLDYFLDGIMRKGIGSTKKETANILRLGAYQLEFMDSIPDYAAISTSVDLAKKFSPGMDKLVNGVLRNWLRKKNEIALPDPNVDLAEYLSIKYSCHRRIVEMLLRQRGEETTEEILHAIMEDQEDKPLTVRVNIGRDDGKERDEIVDSVRNKLREEGFDSELDELSNRILLVKPSPSISNYKEITETETYRSGAISIQSRESCWIADIASPIPGNKVLDVCAAPGGKTMAMAEAMKNQGIIIACDIHPHRLRLIDGYKKRLGIDIVETREIDGRKIESFQDLGIEDFDVILVDAPCSGLGVIRKKPEIKLRPPEISELVKIQGEILKNASHFLRPGGRLIYSTCTINREENENIIKEFILEQKEFRLEFEKQLIPNTHENGYDGFYLASMVRN